MSRIIGLAVGLLLVIGSADAVLSQTVQESGADEAAIEAKIRAQALKSYPWGRQSQQRELWIADRLSEALDRRAGHSYSVRIDR